MLIILEIIVVFHQLIGNMQDNKEFTLINMMDLLHYYKEMENNNKLLISQTEKIISMHKKKNNYNI